MQKVANGPKEVCLDFKRQVSSFFKKWPQIDVTSWITRCALELIGRSGLGYSFDTLAENSIPHRFADAAKELLCVFRIQRQHKIKTFF